MEKTVSNPSLWSTAAAAAAVDLLHTKNKLTKDETSPAI